MNVCVRSMNQTRLVGTQRGRKQCQRIWFRLKIKYEAIRMIFLYVAKQFHDYFSKLHTATSSNSSGLNCPRKLLLHHTQKIIAHTNAEKLCIRYEREGEMAVAVAARSYSQVRELILRYVDRLGALVQGHTTPDHFENYSL